MQLSFHDGVDALRTSGSFIPTSNNFSAFVQMRSFTVWCRLSAVAHPSLSAACKTRCKSACCTLAHCVGNAAWCLRSSNARTEGITQQSIWCISKEGTLLDPAQHAWLTWRRSCSSVPSTAFALLSPPKRSSRTLRRGHLKLPAMRVPDSSTSGCRTNSPVHQGDHTQSAQPTTAPVASTGLWHPERGQPPL